MYWVSAMRRVQARALCALMIHAHEPVAAALRASIDISLRISARQATVALLSIVRYSITT